MLQSSLNSIIKTVLFDEIIIHVALTQPKFLLPSWLLAYAPIPVLQFITSPTPTLGDPEISPIQSRRPWLINKARPNQASSDGIPWLLTIHPVNPYRTFNLPHPPSHRPQRLPKPLSQYHLLLILGMGLPPALLVGGERSLIPLLLMLVPPVKRLEPRSGDF